MHPATGASRRSAGNPATANTCVCVTPTATRLPTGTCRRSPAGCRRERACTRARSSATSARPGYRPARISTTRSWSTAASSIRCASSCHAGACWKALCSPASSASATGSRRCSAARLHAWRRPARLPLGEPPLPSRRLRGCFAEAARIVTGVVHHYLDQLLRTFGRVVPPIEPSTLKSLYEGKDYASMLGWIKQSMKLDLRVGLRIVNAAGPSPPMWIETPRPMPAFGTAEFCRTPVVVNARRDLLETRPFTWIVAGFAHELAHVVLFSIDHPLQHQEKAVDLTAMILGYQLFVADAEVTRIEGAWLSIADADPASARSVLLARHLDQNAPPGLFDRRGSGLCATASCLDGRNRQASIALRRVRRPSRPAATPNQVPRDYAACAAASPLNTRAWAPAEITTRSPSLMRPARTSSASGSCTDFWITRLSGRAP